jgi:hypothetical protein
LAFVSKSTAKEFHARMWKIFCPELSFLIYRH